MLGLKFFPPSARAQGLSKELSLDYFNMRNSRFSPLCIVRNLNLRLESNMSVVSLNYYSLADTSNGKQDCIMVSAALGVAGAT